MILRGGFSHLLQLQIFNCFNRIKLVSTYFRTLALQKLVSLFWLSQNDKSISSVVIRWCIFEWTRPGICVRKALIIYLLSPILDWSTYIPPKTEETQSNTHGSSWSRTSKTQLCVETKPGQQGKNMLIIKWIIYVLLHFTVPDCVSCQTILRGQF